MLQWLRLAVWLLLSAAVSGVEVQCNDSVFYGNSCWDSSTHRFDDCLGCTIINQQTTDNELSIVPKHSNEATADFELVLFSGGDVTKMPKVFNKNYNKQILQVRLWATKTRVLNAQFFGNGAQNLKYFESFRNYNLSVEASAFQNCTELEYLNLFGNAISSIPPDAFRGLDKLVRLDLRDNKLTEISEKWFDDLGNLKRLDLSENQLTEVDETAFENLPKLKVLHLHRNKIEIVTKGMFQHNQQLEEIHLDNNQIKVIQSRSFAHLGKLSWLALSGNKCIDRYFYNPNPEEISAALTACQPTICLIPLIPNGYIVNIEDNVTQTVGDSSEDLIQVKVVCNKSFSLFHERANQTNNICFELKWQHQWPQCLKSCSHQELSGLTISPVCELNGANFPCSGHLLPGTTAYILCHSGYEKPKHPINPMLTCLPSGEWSHSAHKCEPICGKVTVHSTPTIIGGVSTNVTEVPWHVGIYENGEQICGGTIVTERVVISAAHCFSMSTNGSHEIDYKKYQVAAGKIQRGLDAKEAQETQIRDVKEVRIPPSYNGNINWNADISTVLIVGYFEYRPHIAPACVEFISFTPEKYPRAGVKALVAGWGVTEDHYSSETLLSFSIPVVDFRDCREQAPDDFKDKVIGDKICAGSVNKNYTRFSRVVCKGDSGGGLLIPQMVGVEKKFFLQGVVSNSAKALDCDRTFYSLFTNVQEYQSLIHAALVKTHN